MIYEDVGSAGYYSNVAFNATIEVVEKPKLVDMEGIFMYIMIIGVLGGSGEGARVGGGACGCASLCAPAASPRHIWSAVQCWPACTTKT